MSDLTDKQKLFRTQIGQSSTVERGTLAGDRAARPNRLLVDLGLELMGLQKHTENYRYMGSAAVHIYYHDLIQQLDFITQTDALQLYRCPENVASKSFDDLLRAMKAMYGKRHGKLRSGF